MHSECPFIKKKCNIILLRYHTLVRCCGSPRSGGTDRGWRNSKIYNIVILPKCYRLLFRIVSCRLLYSVLPISVATELRHKRPVPPKRFECVTLLFSGIVGFSDYCAGHADSKGAMKIVRMLNQLYTAFDVLTDPKKNPNVYKVCIIIIIIICYAIPDKIYHGYLTMMIYSEDENRENIRSGFYTHGRLCPRLSRSNHFFPEIIL